MKESIDEGLKRWFGHDAFRPGQRAAVEAVVEGRDAVVVMPTGSGKSLCYQLAAMLLPGTTLVVSPLIALMKDQVDALVRKGLPATYINSTVPTREMNARLEKMVAGAYKLVYIAPERFRVNAFLEMLARTNISLLTIDEAHCISQWGHDFRPDYLQIKSVVARFPDVRVMAVTATATPEVREDIRHQLGLGRGTRCEPFVEVLGFARPNLHIAVSHVTALNKLAHVLALIRTHKTGIIYVATRRHAYFVHTELEHELAADPSIELILYHGALSDAERAAAQERFMQATHPVVVATTAFGMGVDRADIRFVAHWDVPGGIEAYYQEIGRAGRDGQPAWCELLFNYSDVRTQEFFNEGANPNWSLAQVVLGHLRRIATGTSVTIETTEFARDIGTRNGMAIETVLKVFQSEGAVTLETGKARGCVSVLLNPVVDVAHLAEVFAAREPKAERDAARLGKMVDFCHHQGCRHAFILTYFGDPDASVCGGCDNCDAAKSRGARSAEQGTWGEQQAEAYLVREGWRVVDRNARPCEKDQRCEIDRIVQSRDRKTIVFVEVKTHQARTPNAPRLFGVDKRKKENLLRACANWILKNRWHGNFRFDVVEVYGDHAKARPPEIDHIENVPLFPPKWRFW